MSQKPFDKYKQAQVLTASREKVLLMLYAGAIKFLKQAIEASNRNENVERVRLIGRAQDIINELRATLDFKASQELAEELERLYVFISASLLTATGNMELKPIEESLKILTTLNDAWVVAVNNLNTQPIQEDK